MIGRDLLGSDAQLGRAWDALIRDLTIDPEGVIDSPLLTTVRYLHDHDDAAAPDPAFVRNLRISFASPSPQNLAERRALGGDDSDRPVPVVRIVPHLTTPEPIRPRRAWLEAVAVILILATVGGILTGRVDSLLRDNHRPGEKSGTSELPRIAAGRAMPDVPMFQGNPQRTGDLPGPGPASTPAILWSFVTGGGIAGAPAVVDGVVYIGSADGSLYAVDALTGAKRWAFAAGAGIASSPAVMSGVVYVGVGDTTADASVLAVDAATGEERWRQTIEGPVVGAPLVVDGGLYIGTNSGILYAFDATTGEERWTFRTGNTIWAASSYADGMIFVGSWDGHVYAINAATGTQRWRFDAGGPVWAAAPVNDGTIFVVTPTGYQPATRQPLSLFALDAVSGRTVRKTELPGTTTDYQSDVPPVAVAEGVVYLQRNRNLYAVDAATGALQGSQAGMPGEEARLSALAGHVIYVPLTNGHLLAIDGRNGARLWDVKVSHDQLSWPVITGGFVYVGDDSGVLYALGNDPTTPASPTAQQ